MLMLSINKPKSWANIVLEDVQSESKAGHDRTNGKTNLVKNATSSLRCWKLLSSSDHVPMLRKVALDRCKMLPNYQKNQSRDRWKLGHKIKK
jgi:hypothetical protein